jgi:peptidoglycan/xylan/chitin deacetylase (PgdA/CDA1 family)
MLKKYFSYLGVLVLACFSFYYTDKAVDIVKRNDPIMKNILANSENYYIDPVSAILNEDEITIGMNGKEVNIDKSYQNMKKINEYNESMLVFDEVVPDISFLSNFDKYIVGGNSSKNQIALIFKVDDSYYVNTVNNILLDKNITATFFMDGSVVENNMNQVLELVSNGYEIENLGYDGEYSMSYFGWTNNMISSLTGENTKFCYTDYKNSNILDLCSSYKMYTIKPTISVTNYPFSTVKKELKSGSMISFNLNDTTIKELPSIISYIKQKGYDIVSLNDLISENLVEEK